MDIFEEFKYRTGLTEDQFDKFLKLKTWSARIRILVNSGLADKDIAKLLGKRQQHVRSVRLKNVNHPREDIL